MDRPDDLDDWLRTPVTPLPPPPGTYRRIVRRARRRRMVRATSAAAAVVVVGAALLAVPRVLELRLERPGSPAAATSTTAGSPRPPTRTTAADRPGVPATEPRRPTASAGDPGPPPVPPRFRPVSVTFVGTGTGWTIGQAGPPCATRFCTSLARTDDGGATWRGVAAPLTGPPRGGTGVGRLRFLDLRHGWAFGPELWATHDGGARWRRIGLGGRRVTSLEAVGSRAYAVFADCPDGRCGAFALHSASAGSDDWRPVPGAAGAGTAELVLSGSRGYLLARGPAGVTLHTGGTSGVQAWAPLPTPCSPGTQGALAAVEHTHLALVCSADGIATSVFGSADGGLTWTRRGSVPGRGPVASAALADPRTLFAAPASGGIRVSRDGGRSWQVGAGTGSGRFAYVGFTTPRQGVAVPADPDRGALWFTYDGGRSWSSVRIG